MCAAVTSLALLLAGMLLCTAAAQAQDGPFSATRKMQGLTRRPAASSSSTTNGQQADPSESMVDAPNVELEPETASDAPPTNHQPEASTEPAAEQPKAAPQPIVKAATRPGYAGDATGASGGGLKAFQQRLAAVRNSSASEQVPTAAVAPQIDLPGASAEPTADSTGPNNGPTPPPMPEIRAFSHPAPFDNSSAQLETKSVKAAEPTPAISSVSRRTGGEWARAHLETNLDGQRRAIDAGGHLINTDGRQSDSCEIRFGPRGCVIRTTKPGLRRADVGPAKHQRR